MSYSRELYEDGMAHGKDNERERIAKWLETHSVDHDASILAFDEEDYSEFYAKYDRDEDGEYDEFKAKACSRRALADRVRTGE